MGLSAALAVALAVPSARAQASPARRALDQLTGMAGPRPVARGLPAPRVTSGPDELRACFFDGAGSRAPQAAVFAAVREADVVYAGEKHDSAAHHAAQLRLLDELLAGRPAAFAGFEMLHVTHQPALDAYLAGATDRAAFQRAVDWTKTWGYPFELYEPLFERLRGASARGAALNVPKAVVSKTAVSGLASLTPEERRFVPPDLRRPDDPAYLAMLAETFRAHGGDPSDAVSFGNFIDAMSLWNEGMAWNLLRAGPAPERPALVVLGAFHAFRAGVPGSLARRARGLRQASIVLLEGSSCPARLPPSDTTLGADFYWLP